MIRNNKCHRERTQRDIRLDGINDYFAVFQVLGDQQKFKFIHAFYHGVQRRPDTTFGPVNDDVRPYCDPSFKRRDFCKIDAAISLAA